MREFQDAAAFVRALATERFWVFGTGFVASMLVHALDKNCLHESLEGYMASSPAHGACFDGRAVLPISDSAIARDALVVVAVHGANLDSVLDALLSQGYSNVAWAYPHLHEMIYGEPLFRGVHVPLSYLLARQNPEHLWIAVRALAARGMLQGDEALGHDAYVRAQALHCSGATAQMRYEALKELLFSMVEHGYDEEWPVLADTSMRIIDGLHRIAAAWLLGMRSIPCNIVRADSAFDTLLTDRNTLAAVQLADAGLDERQIAEVRSIAAEMRIGPGDGPSPSAPAISMIVPAYNVSGYIGTFIDSVKVQTFTDFEVLLIDDGSTDSTAELAEAWAACDPRVIALHKPNSGVSPTRNLGIELARGEYLAFADPDDWLDEAYLEKLHAAAVKEDADLVVCDIWRYNNRTGAKIHRSCGQRMGVRYTLEEHMRYGPTASYKAISRRSLWIGNNVRFPDIAFESPAVFALVVALAAERAAYVPEPLYYYRRFRENSLVETAYAKAPGVADNTLGVEAMEHLMAQFEAHGLSERFAAEMPGLVTWRLNDILALQYYRRSAEDFAELVANQRAFVERAFPDLPAGPYITWGGYNLNKILQHLPMLNDPSCRFNFSSIAAVALGQPSCKALVQHPNRYREMMLRREANQEIWEVLAAQQPRFIFMDFVDERFDLVEAQGRWLTCSDAFDGAELFGIDLGGRLLFGTEQRRAVWCEAFEAFAHRIRLISPATQLVIVEGYLSERVGSLEGTHEFDGIEAIRGINAELAAMYAIARDVCPEAAFVPAFSCDGYFTDAAFEYGAKPQHLNDLVNQRIARMIEEAVL